MPTFRYVRPRAVLAVILGVCGACAGQGPTGPDGPCPVAGGPPRALLALDCGGALVAGLADWEAAGRSVSLELLASEPPADHVVEAWPPANRPPWLGHPPARTLVLPPRGIRVEFLAGDSVPVRLFADPRLAGAFRDGTEQPGGDARDRIDRGEPVRTRDGRAIDYGRALGRTVTREGFDRVYVVVLRHGADPEAGRQLAARVAGLWERSGAAGARRAWDPRTALPVGEGCWPLDAAVIRDAGRDGRTDRVLRSGTVSYPEGDPAARDVGERLVSATLPGGDAEWLAPSGLAVRPYRPGEPPVEGDDVATVVPVTTGPAHPCSVWGELRWVEAWFGVGAGDQDGGVTMRVLPIGETAAFLIGPAGTGARDEGEP